MNPVPTTDPARWRRIELILDLILDLPPAERSTLLDESCARDPALRAEVEAILTADAQAGGFLATPAGEYAPDLLADAVEEEEGEPDLSGHQVGPYRLVREIGSGGMGTVYEAEDARLGRRVAVKLLPPEYNRDRRAKERFLREARAAAAVDHPNLCTIHDVGESDGRLYIVLTFYEGETLRERIRRGPLPFAEAQDVAIQVARGLARAHEAGIVHRDIKPANVILTRRGEAKILDFGVARLEGDEASLTRTGASWGTPAYMSPEQARGEPMDGRTDIWSLGVMLYEMLAGRRPFGGDSLEAVVSAILTRNPEPLKRARQDVPPELARVVERALAKDLAERYRNAAELLEDLASGKAAVWPVLQRIRGKVLWASLLTIVLVMAGVLFLFVRDRPTLRVAVLQPVLKSVGSDPELAFVASEVVEATHSTLLSLKRLQPLDPPEGDEKNNSRAERLRTAEADEVLLSLLDCRDNSCQVIFRRQKSGGDVLATVGPFEVLVGIENAYQLADGVRAHLQLIYSNHQPRSGSPGSRVRPQDYAEYIKLERQVDIGKRLGKAELAQLDALLGTSPDLLGAYLLAAGIARNHEPLDRTFAYVSRAEEMAPHDPAPLLLRLRIETEENQVDAAAATLERLEDLAPGDTRVQSAKADLLVARGELNEALRLREEIARRRPTWRRILEVAMLEVQLGKSDSARQRLEHLLAAQPDNQFLRENLADLEAKLGDLNRAAALYEELIRSRPTRRDLTNLGFVRFLLGDYEAAAQADQRALALEPGHHLTRFNLATALAALGDLDKARSLYSTLAKEFAAISTPLDVHTRMLYAQCLARLGLRKDAERLADEVLKQMPEDVQILNQAAQLYSLLEDPVSARFYAKKALQKGLRREWFTIPEFRAFQEDPEFRILLESRGLGRHAT